MVVEPRRWLVLYAARGFRSSAVQPCGDGLAVAGRHATVRNVGDLARFGELAFQLVVPLELVIVMFFPP